MKKIIFSIILTLVVISCLDLSAQTYNTGKQIVRDTSYLYNLPQAERESILLSVSKAALLRWGPGYYKDTHRTEIEDLGYNNINLGLDYISDYNGRVYKVTYLYDANVELLPADYAAEVFVRSDNAKVTEIMFGNGVGRSSLDTVPEDEVYPPIKYQQRHEVGWNIIKRASIYELSPTGDSLWYRQNDAGKLIRTDREGNDLFPSFDAGNNAGRFTGTNP